MTEKLAEETEVLRIRFEHIRQELDAAEAMARTLLLNAERKAGQQKKAAEGKNAGKETE